LLLSKLVETFEKMEGTSSRLLLTDYLVSRLRETPCEIVDKVIYLIQGKLGPSFEGIELGLAEKMAIRALSQSSGKSTAEILEVYRKKGDLGDTTGEVMKSKNQNTLFSEEMTVERVYFTLDKIARSTGPGSQETKQRLVSSLLNDTTPEEARYIMKFLMGTLRLGIADFTVLDALSIAFTNDKSNRSLLENAYNVSGDLGMVAKKLACDGVNSVRSILITLFKPIRPMLAERVPNLEEGLERMDGIAAAEYKLDGERVQIHKGSKKRRIVKGQDGKEEVRVELFSRRLEKITSHYPDIIEAAKAMVSIEDVILEGEIVAVDPSTSEYLPFQELMHRRRKYGIARAMESYPVVVYVFDVLYNKGKSMTSLPYTERRSILKKIIADGARRERNGSGNARMRKIKGSKTPTIKNVKTGEHEGKQNQALLKWEADSNTAQREKVYAYGEGRDVNHGRMNSGSLDSPVNKLRLIPQIVSRSLEEIQAFMDLSIEAGCEGIMLKHLESVYRAGSREFLWIKVKREYRSELADTLDLVIVGALYGRGRRVGRYGALLLAVYDENQDLFRSVSKVGTGFTDQDLEKFYNSLEHFRVDHRSPRVDTRMEQMDVWFEPKIVIEVIASEITLSPAHTAALDSVKPNYGLALRFPKFTGRIRYEKNPEDATTVQELIKMFKQQLKKQTRSKAG
jgi:ATP-dependent DNA ligase